jgi:hypothetical protein
MLVYGSNIITAVIIIGTIVFFNITYKLQGIRIKEPSGPVLCLGEESVQSRQTTVCMNGEFTVP